MMSFTPGIALEPPVELRNPPVLNVKTEQVEDILDKSLIKQITYHKDSIKIDLYEFPHIGLNLGTHPELLDERLEWLPRLDSNQRQGG